MKEMSPKERALAFYKHQPTDKLPTDNDIFVLFNPSGYHERPPFVQSGKDWFGVEWKREDALDAIAPDHTKPPIMEDICDWRELVKFPDLDSWDWSQAETVDHVSEYHKTDKLFVMMFVNGPFERLHMLMGFENALCALLTDPEEVEAFFDAFMEWKLKLMEYVIKYYDPDVLMFHDDWGSQKNMFMSPETWRELIKPQIQKAVDKCHEMGKIFEMHSCGFIEAIVPDFVEMGIDSWQGMEINDVAKLKKETGGKLSFHMTQDYQNYYTRMMSGSLTDEEERKEVKETLLKTAEGYCYSPMFLPFGGHAKDVMIDETLKLAETIYV